MSKKKDRARATAGEIHRDGKTVKLRKCPVPLCEEHVITGNSANGLCPKHEEELAFLLFILPHIRFEQKTPGGLATPYPTILKLTGHCLHLSGSHHYLNTVDSLY